METHGGLHMTHRLFRPKSFHFRLRRAGAVVATVSAAAISVAGLSAAPASAARSATIPATPPTVVSFTFDNQWASQMTAATALKAHNMAGTFYIISGWIGQPGFMSLANLNTLAANGDEIGGKTVNNADLPTKSNAEAQREICQGRNVLLAASNQILHPNLHADFHRCAKRPIHAGPQPHPLPKPDRMNEIHMIHRSRHHGIPAVFHSRDCTSQIHQVHDLAAQ